MWVRSAAAIALLAMLAGCAPVPQPSGSASPAPGSRTPTASSTAAPIDFTVPGVARAVVHDLVEASGSRQVVLVSIRKREATVGVLLDGKAHTWAYREGAIKEIPTDLVYVDQVTYSPDSFDLSDVGALFRAAAAVSGSDSNQELQIIDQRRVEHAASELKMSVSTNPETRTVFFDPDGRIVPTLDFNTPAGIAAGLADAVGSHTAATAVAVSSAGVASIDYVAPDGVTAVRRERRARFPVQDVPRGPAEKLATFDPHVVSASVVWTVLQRASGGVGPLTSWSVVADASVAGQPPRLRFTVGTTKLVTDLLGTEIKE